MNAWCTCGTAWPCGAWESGLDSGLRSVSSRNNAAERRLAVPSRRQFFQLHVLPAAAPQICSPRLHAQPVGECYRQLALAVAACLFFFNSPRIWIYFMIFSFSSFCYISPSVCSARALLLATAEHSRIKSIIPTLQLTAIMHTRAARRALSRTLHLLQFSPAQVLKDRGVREGRNFKQLNLDGPLSCGVVPSASPLFFCPVYSVAISSLLSFRSLQTTQENYPRFISFAF